MKPKTIMMEELVVQPLLHLTGLFISLMVAVIYMHYRLKVKFVGSLVLKDLPHHHPL